MEEVFVNEIREQNGAIRGIAIDDDLVIKNLYKVVGDTAAKGIIVAITSQHDLLPAHFFTKYFQFVVIFMNGEHGISMEFLDLGNSDDVALDHYQSLQAKRWTNEHRQKIMLLHQEIQKGDQTKAKLVVVNPVL